MCTRDVKLSFPNNNIKKIHPLNFTFYVTVLTSFQENDPYVINADSNSDLTVFCAQQGVYFAAQGDQPCFVCCFWS